MLANLFMDALNNSETERLLSYLSEDVKMVGASGLNYGKPELIQYFNHYVPPFKDTHNTRIGTYAVDNIVIIENVLEGIHVSDYMGIKASNKSFKMPILNVFKVNDDLITEWRQYQNTKILIDLHNR
jgi:limonene-1,2-epoxide hydrolase